MSAAILHLNFCIMFIDLTIDDSDAQLGSLGAQEKLDAQPGSLESQPENFDAQAGSFDAQPGSLDAQETPLTLRDLFQDINNKAFGGKLPYIPVKFNRRLKSTGGQFVRHAGLVFIDISPSVCRTLDSIREILAHEMCHYAQYALDKKCGRKMGHGADFKRWGSLVEQRLGIKVSTFHKLEVHRKYVWTCTSCSHDNRSHSVGKTMCKRCKSKFVIK